MSKRLFITGTGTDVGKTYVTGLILKKLHEQYENVAYYKAAMSGNDRRPDGSLILEVSGVPVRTAAEGTDVRALMDGYISVGQVRNMVLGEEK